VQSTAARELALDLQSWFDELSRTCERTLFATGDAAHHEAAVIGFATGNARRLTAGPLDASGALYTPTCLLLAALCERNATQPRMEHWYAAIDNVTSLQLKLAELAGNPSFGVDLGTPASVFLDLTYEALADAGLLREPTLLDDESRKRAELLAINWALRFLLAYALDARPPQETGQSKQGLAWMHRRMKRAASEAA